MPCLVLGANNQRRDRIGIWTLRKWPVAECPKTFCYCQYDILVNLLCPYPAQYSCTLRQRRGPLWKTLHAQRAFSTLIQVESTSKFQRQLTSKKRWKTKQYFDGCRKGVETSTVVEISTLIRRRIDVDISTVFYSASKKRWKFDVEISSLIQRRNSNDCRNLPVGWVCTA